MLLASFKGLLIFLWVTACAGACAIQRRVKPSRSRAWIIRLCYRGLLFIIGVRLRVEGHVSPARPLLLVSNHSSYVDVMILGALLAPRFTPKAEVATWPLIGWICTVTDCIFIDRRMHKTHENREKLREAAAEGAPISLFPEGTTNDGKRLLPFRSSYFALAGERFNGQPLIIQPVAITYTRIRNLPIDASQRPKIAWYGDMPFVPHLAQLLTLGSIEARVSFCEPIRSDDQVDRKAVALLAKGLIEKKLYAN